MSVFQENKSKGLSDKEILIRFKDKNSRNYAFDLLCRKYQQQIYFHIRRMLIDHDDSNDVTQEVFIKIWKNLDMEKFKKKLMNFLQYRGFNYETCMAALNHFKKNCHGHAMDTNSGGDEYEN